MDKNTVKLTELYNKLNLGPYFSSDKGTIHSYISHLYENIFEPYKTKNIKLLELGIWSGSCLLLWEKYFENAEKIVGVDIDLSNLKPDVIQESTRNKKIKIIHHNVTESSLVSCLDDMYDIIIDDASHAVEDQLTSFNLLKDKLNPGGIFVIEDIQSENDAVYLNKNIPNSVIIDLRHIKNRYDDLVLVYKK